MKTVCYASSMNTDLYPDNKNSKFCCQLSEDSLSYIQNVHKRFQYKDSCSLSSSDNLAIAVKSLSFPSIKTGILAKHGEEFEGDTEHDTVKAYKATVFGLKSTITSEFVTFNNRCDKIIATFIVEDWSQDVCSIEIENPTFYQSSFALLCRPSFELIELVSNSTVSGIDGTTTSIPTVCEIIVKQSQVFQTRMLPPFNLLLASNDTKSQEIYSSNNNVQFTSYLNQRIELPTTSTWTIVLKSFQMTSKLYNIQSSNYYFSYFEIELKSELDLVSGMGGAPKVVFPRVPVPFGYYPNVKALCDKLNKQFTELSVPVTIKQVGKKVKFYAILTKVGETDKKQYRFKCSPELSNLLGFTKLPSTSFMQDLGKMTEQGVAFPYNVNLNHGRPKNLLIQCSVARKMNIAGRMQKLLKFVHIPDKKPNNDVISFNFYNNTYAQLETHWFDCITVSITDLNGKAILAQQEDTHPSVLHLMFINV